MNFAVYSENASAVELCLFDVEERETRIAFRNRSAFVWHACVPEVQVGTRYGNRVHGAYDGAHVPTRSFKGSDS